MNQVATSISNGRIPWQQEPSCASANCHDANHAPNTNTLYRQSKGHGGLFCEASYGSPHAIVPTNQPNDNLQNITWQGFAGKLQVCEVCHGYTPNMPGPHGYMPVAINEIQGNPPKADGFVSLYPNPVSNGEIQISIQVKNKGDYRVQIFDLTGKQVALIAHEDFPAGVYNLPVSTAIFAKGTYVVRFSGKDISDSRKFVVQ